MAEVVDSIIADLIVRGIDQYEANFDRAAAAHGRFGKTVDALSRQTFDLAAEGQKYKAGADKIGQAEEQVTQRVTRARKARTDASVQADRAEATSAKAASDAVVASEAKKQAAIEKTAASRGKVSVASDLFSQGSGVKPGTGANIGVAVPGRAEAERATEIMRQTRVEAEAVAAAETEVNHALLDAFDLRQKAAVAEGATKRALQDEIAYLQRIATYKRGGLTDEQAAVRAEREMVALEKIRAENAEKQAVAQRATGGAHNSGSGLRQAFEGATLGYSPSPAAFAGIAAAGAVAGVAELAKKGLEYAQTLKQDSDQLGLTTRDFQLYQRAAQEAGVTTDQFKSAFSALANNIGKAQEGDKQLGRVFGKDGLNIDLGNAKDGFKSLSDVLPTYLERLSKIPDQQRRFALETASGSEELRKLDPVLSQGATSFEQWSQGIEKAGGILADSEIQKSAETAKKISLLNDELQRDLASTVAKNADAIYTLAKAFLQAADGAVKFFGAMKFNGDVDKLNQTFVVRAKDFVTGRSHEQSRQEGFDSLLDSQQGRDYLLRNNTSQLNALNIADKGGVGAGGPVNLPGLGDITNDPKQRYALHQRVIAERARILAAQRAADKQDAPTPPQAGGPGNGNVFTPAPPKGKSAQTLENERLARDKRYADQLDQLQEEALRAQQDMTGSIEDRAKIEDELAKRSLARRITDINLERDRNVNQGENAGEANNRAATLRKQAEADAVAAKRVRDQQTAADLAQATNAHAQTSLSINDELLNSQLSLARTTKDRLAIEEKLLANAKERERGDLDTQLATLKPGDPARADVQARRDSLDQRYAGQDAALKDRELTPGQQYRRGLEVNSDTIQSEQVKLLDQFNKGLDDSIAKSLHLHGIFGDIVKDLIDMAIKQAVIAPLSGALFGGGTGAAGGALGGLLGSASKAFSGGGGGLLGSLGKLFGAGGGGVTDDEFASIASGFKIALPGLATGGSFEVGGNPGVDRNLLSINGKPTVRVGQGETVAVIPKTIGSANGRVAPATNVTQVHQTINVDGRNSVTPDDFAQQIIAVSADHANRVARQAASGAVQAAPARVQQKQMLGS